MRLERAVPTMLTRYGGHGAHRSRYRVDAPRYARLCPPYGVSFPKLLARQPCPLGEGSKLCPHHVGIDCRLADPGAVAAVGAGDDVLAPDQPSVASDALGDQVGMLDEVRFGFDHARDQHFSLGQLHPLEQGPFVRMARVGGLEREAVRTRQEHDIDDVGEWHVAMMRALVVAPTEVQAE